MIDANLSTMGMHTHRPTPRGEQAARNGAACRVLVRRRVVRCAAGGFCYLCYWRYRYERYMYGNGCDIQ